MYTNKHLICKMGVKGNSQILPQPIKFDTRRNKGKYVVIDTMPILFRWAIGSYNNGKYIVDSRNRHMTETFIIFKTAIRFLRDSIIPIFVFDGSVPKNKNVLINRRVKQKNKAVSQLNDIINSKADTPTDTPVFNSREEYNNYLTYIKRSYSVNRNNINLAKFILQWMGLPIIDAPGEADSQCAAIALMYPESVIGVVSDDFDPIMYMSSNIIKITSIYSNYFEMYTLSNILNYMEHRINNIINTTNDTYIGNKYKKRVNFTHRHLVDIGCLMGTDYCPRLCYGNKIHNDKIDDLLEIYLKHDMDVYTLLNSLHRLHIVSTSYKTKMLNSINVYTTAKTFLPQDIDMTFNKPNINMIRYICNDFVDTESLNSSLTILMKAYNDCNRKHDIDERDIIDEHYNMLPNPKHCIDIATIKI